MVNCFICGTGELIGDSGIVCVYDFNSLQHSGEAVSVTTLQVALTPSGTLPCVNADMHRPVHNPSRWDLIKKSKGALWKSNHLYYDARLC